MPGNHSRPRRQYTSTREDDDGASSFSVPRADDSRVDSFSRSKPYSNASDRYRTPPPSKSDMRNEGSSSSRRRDADERRQGDEGHAYSPSKDTKRRNDRDDRDDLDSPSWGSRKRWHEQNERENGNSNQKDSWTPRYDRDRDTGFSRWTPKDTRSDQRGDRQRKGYGSHHGRTDSWGRDEPRDSYNERRRDNGWASRQRSNADESAQYGPSESHKPTNDDRSWEPSSSWQSGNGRPERHDRNDNQGQRKHKQHKNKKGKKQGDNSTNSKKRDWRNDDGHWNKYVKTLLYSVASSDIH